MMQSESDATIFSTSQQLCPRSCWPVYKHVTSKSLMLLSSGYHVPSPHRSNRADTSGIAHVIKAIFHASKEHVLFQTTAIHMHICTAKAGIILC
jgi:hypothetical protein